MYYVKPIADESGNHGNPQSNPFINSLMLPDELLEDYVSAMGFVNLTDADGVVSAVSVNQIALDAYLDAHKPVEKTPAEKREDAYNTEALIAWGGENITVTKAATLWSYYSAEGNADKAEALTALIAAAKADIRERFPDTEVTT